MLHNRLALALASLFVPLACAGDDGSAATLDDSTGGSSSGSTTSPVESSGNTTAPAETSGGGSTSGADESSSAAGSSDGSCPPGDAGCPCTNGTCSGTNVCSGDVCQPAEVCAVDGYEPNNSMDAAAALGDLDDDADPGSVAGVLDHAEDEDWFTYNGFDTTTVTPQVAPTRTLVADGSLRLCKFLRCPDALESTEVTCPDNAELAMAPGGEPGCCASEGFAMPDFNCAGGNDDSAQVWLRVDQAGAQCVEYTVTYEY